MEKAAVSLDCVCRRAFASGLNDAGMDDAGHLLSSSAPIKRACTLRSRTWLAPPKAIFQFPMGQRFALAQQDLVFPQ